MSGSVRGGTPSVTGADRPPLGRFRSPLTPAVADERLTGGLHGLAVRRPGVPLVELRLAVPLGAPQLSRPASTLVLAESLLAGTEDHDRSGLAIALERIGATLHAGASGDLFLLSGSCLASSLPLLFELLSEVLVGATYPTAEVQSDRARLADEMTIALSRPEVVADEAFAKRRYGRHPYAAGLPRPDDLLAVAPTTLRRLHRRLLGGAGAHIVLVGDLQPRRALSLVEGALAGWVEHGTAGAGGDPGASGRPDELGELAPIPPLRSGGIDLVDRAGAVQSNLRVAAPAPDRSAPDWPAFALANQIFGGMFTSRLVTNLRERNGYTYSPRSRVEHMRAGSACTIAAEVATEVTAAALVETRYELGRIVSAGVTDDEVEGARRYGIGSYLYQTATQSGLASSLAGLAIAGIDPSYLGTYPARLARVTRSEVDEAARRYLSPAATATVVVGDAALVSDSLASIDEVRQG